MVIPRDHLATIDHEYEHGAVELHFWRCRLIPDLADLSDPVAPFRWVPFSQLSTLRFPEANQAVLEQLALSGRT